MMLSNKINIVAHITITILIAKLSIGSVEASAASCHSAIHINSSDNYRLIVIDAQPVKGLVPSFFGFNLEWNGFQDSFWDEQKNEVKSNVVSWMKAFPGAVYRYPGGTVSNYFNWSAATGKPQARKAQKAVDWRAPIAAKFGVDEYLRFVQQIGGRAWIVANLYGRFEGEDDEVALARQAGLFSKYVAAQTKKLAMPPVLRWELGNELDRDRYQWPPDKYTQRAQAVITAMREVDLSSQFVGIMEDYDAQAKTSGILATQYNRAIANGLLESVREYAQHYYYDGPTGGPPIPNRLRQLCSSIADAQASLPPGHPPGIWITEHARWPQGDPSSPDWKNQWWRTTTLEGALAVADLIIATTQVPEVNGAFLHTLSGTGGPWPLFHGGVNGRLNPSAIYWTLNILREAMLEEALPVQVSSLNQSGYEGGYDVRATVLANRDRKRFAVWAVNRHSEPVALDLQLPTCGGCNLRFKRIELSDNDPKASNSLIANRLMPKNATGTWATGLSGGGQLKLAPYSVTTYVMDKL